MRDDFDFDTRRIAVVAPDEATARRLGIDLIAECFPNLDPREGGTVVVRLAPGAAPDAFRPKGTNRDVRWRVTVPVDERTYVSQAALDEGEAKPGLIGIVRKLSLKVLGGENAMFELLGYPKSAGAAKVMVRLLNGSQGQADPVEAFERAFAELDLDDITLLDTGRAPGSILRVNGARPAFTAPEDEDDEDKTERVKVPKVKVRESRQANQPEAKDADADRGRERKEARADDHARVEEQARVTPDTITCSRCDTPKPADQFSPSSQRNGRGWCKACSREAQQARRARERQAAGTDPVTSQARVKRPTHNSVEGIRCPRCDTTKPLSEFKPSVQKRGYGNCRECESEYRKERRQQSQESSMGDEQKMSQRPADESAHPGDVDQVDYSQNGSSGSWRERFVNPTLEELEELRDFIGAPTLDEAAQATRLLAAQ